MKRQREPQCQGAGESLPGGPSPGPCLPEEPPRRQGGAAPRYFLPLVLVGGLTAMCYIATVGRPFGAIVSGVGAVSICRMVLRALTGEPLEPCWRVPGRTWRLLRTARLLGPGEPIGDALLTADAPPVRLDGPDGRRLAQMLTGEARLAGAEPDGRIFLVELRRTPAAQSRGTANAKNEAARKSTSKRRRGRSARERQGRQARSRSSRSGPAGSRR